MVDRDRRVESATVRTAKLAGLVVAVALLCGAIVAAAFLDRQRDVQTQHAFHSAEITGARALAGPAPVSEDSGSAQEEGAGDTGPTVTQRSDSPEHSPSAGPVTGPSPRAESAGKSARPDKRRIRSAAATFYRLIASRPEEAARMLGGSLLADGPDELVRSWSSVADVDIHELTVRDDGMVHAMVTMAGGDSERLRVSHLLRIDHGPPPVITEATLLSSQHTTAPGG